MEQLTQLNITENQLKVIKDKYLKDSPTIESWLRGVAKNIALTEILYSKKVSELDIFKNVQYERVDYDFNKKLFKFFLIHRNIREHNKRMENFKKFIKNLYDIAERNPELIKETEEKFYKMLSNFEFLPNSPTLMNAGRDLQQLSACYVLPVGDSMEEIYEAIKNTSLIHQAGGGTGFSFSKLRPKGDGVKSTKGVASGPITFMEVFNKSTDVIIQGGTRRGANMGILHYTHPDIMEFINMKKTPGVMENFNISVSVNDKFMQAVKNNEDYDLINPRDKKPVGTLNAKEVWKEMIKGAWETGDPGIIFIDRMNNPDSNPTPALGQIESTNPCLSGNTFIFTNQSIHQIRDLTNFGSELKLLVDLRSIGEEGSSLVNGRAIHTGKKMLYRIILKNGMFVDATENHKIMTNKGFVEVKNLKISDKICIHIEDILPTHSNDIDKNVAQLLGWLIGDGWVYCDNRYSTNYKHYGFVFGKGDLIALNKIKKVLEQFDIPFKERINKGCTEIFCCGKKPMEFFNPFGINFEKEKSIPNKILNGGRDNIIGFLQGLFSSDGYVSKPYKNRRRIVLTSVSPKLLHQVQVLLTSLGIYSSVKKGSISKGIPYGKGKISRARQRYDLYITANSFFKFVNKIGFPLNQNKKERANIVVKLTKDLKFSKSIPSWSKLINIISLYEEEVYDIKESIIHSFIANGIVVHNCGEQPLLSYEVCNLGSINLSKFIKDDRTDFDYNKLGQCVFDATHFLDNVIDVNNYPIQEIEEMAKINRRIGLGVMGWAESLALLSIPYNSEKAFKKAEEVMKFINDNSLKASEELAITRGVFPAFKDSVYDKTEKYFKGKEVYPRNCARTTIAPTGTIAITAGLQGSGIEPFFSLVYIRYNAAGIDALKEGKKPLDKNTFFEVNPIFEETAKKNNYFGLTKKELYEKINDNHKSIKEIEEIPEYIQNRFLTSHDLTPESHVLMQCAFQKYVNNAVSKTVNMKNEATQEDVEKVYWLAYENGAKGVTVYRDGSKSFQVLNLSEKKKEEKKKDLPEFSDYYPMQTGQGPIHIHINYNEEGPTRVFANLSPSGTEISGLTTAIAILLSKYFKLGGDPVRILKHLNSVKSEKPYGFGKNRIDSISHAISIALRKHLIKTGKIKTLDSLKDDKEQKRLIEELPNNGDIIYCPQCFSSNVGIISGCSEPTCFDCGYSKCS